MNLPFRSAHFSSISLGLGHKAWPVAIRLFFSLALIASMTFLFYRFLPVNALTVGFTYLVAILVLAATWGAAESIAASLLAVSCLNFFFMQPIGTFTIADPQNWVALFAFLITSIVASQLSARAKRRAQEALEREQDLERLYALSRAILLTDPSEQAPKQIAHQIARVFDFQGVILFERASGEFHKAGPEDIVGIEEKLRESALQGSEFQDRSQQTEVAAIRLGGEPIGSVAICGSLLSDSALQALCNLVAGGLEKTRAQKAVSQAEAARQSQEFKSVLLDAIAHEFNTPLASIKTATSSILSGIVENPGDIKDLLGVANEEADRLKRFVADALELARIDAALLELNLEPHSIEQIIRSLVEEMISAPTEIRLKVLDAPQSLPLVTVDGKLIKLAIRQLVDNALKYSAPSALVEIGLGHADNNLIISISDRGHGIPIAEQAKVFEKFYRGSVDRSRVPGTGMGLPIASQIVAAHGGRISQEPREGGGSIFWITIPVKRGGVSI